MSMTDVTMTSGFSTIAGSVLAAYINLGVPAQNLVTSSVMSIPASIAISKMRLPETEEPVTRGRVTVDRGEGKTKPVSQSIAKVWRAAHDGPSGKRSTCLQPRRHLRSHRRGPDLVSWWFPFLKSRFH